MSERADTHRRSGLPALALAVLLAASSACQKEPAAPAPLAGGSTEPAATVRELVDYVQRNDLVGFARAAVPAEDHAQLEQAWREGRSRWPLTELPLDQKIIPMVIALSQPGAEARLQATFDKQFAGQTRDLKNAARSLGLFGQQYVSKEGDYSDNERKHYVQVIGALSAWGQQAPLGDRALATTTIKRLAAAARQTGISSEEQVRSAGMTDTLRRLAPFFAEMKASFARYGLPLDTSLANLRTGLLQQQGDEASVRIHYPLGDREIDSVVRMQRRANHWYLSDYLHDAEQARPPVPDPAAPTPAVPPPPELQRPGRDPEQADSAPLARAS
ncbi:hypothetical protein [Pseudoxanthomonas dokdonensis]|uniref:hypothetical protein n=1 Tax=Pseudoxanthomonas dokdonensis TaxID=344882 RepID=UPI000AAB6005|nr:hypothetical protein [Pseudoxanthomonas dokdonensis]